MSCVVLDTNVIVSALLSPYGNPAKIYKMFLDGTLTMVCCRDIYREYQDILHRPRLRLSDDDITAVLTNIGKCGKKIDPAPSTSTMIDEDDRIFYDTAKSAGAYLITGNKKHFPAESFILTPTEFLML